MSNSELQAELVRLRGELEALSKQANNPTDQHSNASIQAEPIKDDTTQAQGAEALPNEGSVPDSEGVSTKPDDTNDLLHGQFGELMHLLENEIKDLPTVTCLAVFSLGILLGRLTR